MNCSTPLELTFGAFYQQEIGSLPRSLGAAFADASTRRLRLALSLDGPHRGVER